jgi:hypothetical protein
MIEAVGIGEKCAHIVRRTMKKKANEWDGLKEGNGKEVKIQFHLNPSKSVFSTPFCVG